MSPQGRWQPYGDSEQDPTQGQSSLGSGVIVAAQGHILTNNHVVAGAGLAALRVFEAVVLALPRGLHQAGEPTLCPAATHALEICQTEAASVASS